MDTPSEFILGIPGPGIGALTTRHVSSTRAKVVRVDDAHDYLGVVSAVGGMVIDLSARNVEERRGR